MSEYPPCPGYELLELLARGGGQLIFRARQKETHRIVRLHLVHGGDRFGRQAADHLCHEAKVLVRLNHLNIIRFIALGVARGYGSFMVTAPADLQDIGTLTRLRVLEAEEVLRIIRPIATALDHAHGYKIVHGDVHPQNILVDCTGHIFVDGFGRLDKDRAESEAIIGNPHFMAPEQISHSSTTVPETDVYGLAELAYFLLCGSYPFQYANEITDLLERKCSQSPPSIMAFRLNLPRGVDRVLQRGMALNPDDRYGSPGKFADALSRALDGQKGKGKWWRWW